MGTEMAFEILDTVSLADGRPTHFIILDTIQVGDISSILAVPEEDMQSAQASNALPPVYGFKILGEDLLPLDQAQKETLLGARRRRGSPLSPLVTIQFPGDPWPVRCEEEALTPLGALNGFGSLVALYSVTDDHDIRIAISSEGQAGTKSYAPIPESFSTDALEITRFLFCKRRLLRSLDLGEA